MGGVAELATGEFVDLHASVSIHLIDSLRPYNLSNLFGRREEQKRVIVWDDGDVEKLEEERKAYEALEVCSTVHLLIELLPTKAFHSMNRWRMMKIPRMITNWMEKTEKIPRTSTTTKAEARGSDDRLVTVIALLVAKGGGWTERCASLLVS